MLVQQQSDGTLELLAPAKVNLYLEITGRREDGYHLLDSLVVFVNTGDKITARCLKNGILSCVLTGPFADDIDHLPDGNNIMLQAAELLRKTGKTGLGASLSLEKMLPVSAGIGGGSSDAATTLKALGQLWKCTHSPKQLAGIGLELGADIPACLAAPQAVHMAGIGEILTPVNVAQLNLVLVNPGVKVATRDIFRRISPPYREAEPWLKETGHTVKACLEALKNRTNDLQQAAEAACPEITVVLDMLTAQKQCALAHMSGSGATCFGIFPDAESAENAANTIQETRPDWWVRACVTL